MTATAPQAAAPARVPLRLLGVVGMDITAEAVSRELEAAKGAPLTISLHSYGGDALAGIAIHNMLARYKGDKQVVVEGIAASAASLIAMAGDRIIMPSNAFLMIHNAWSWTAGDAETMRDQADVLDMISAAYRGTYARKTGLPEAEVADLMNAETWLMADAALASGFATEVSDPVEIRADAAALARFHQVPAALLHPATTPQQPAAPAQSEEDRVSELTTTVAPQAPETTPATLGEIKAIAARGKLGDDFVVAQLEASATEAQAMAAALDVVASAAPKPVTSLVQVTADEGDKFRVRAEAALVASLTGKQPGEEAREIYSLGLLGLARDIMARRGERNVHRLSNEDVAHRILAAGDHSSGDFSGILTNSTNKSLRALFAGMPNTWGSWCDEIEVADMKEITAASVAAFPEPQVFPQGGQVPAGTVAEEFETYRIRERGVLIGLTFEAIINDDLRAFQRIIQQAAMGGYTALRRAVFTLLTANGNMRDGVALFHANRGNLGTAGNLTAASMRELYTLLAQQTEARRAEPAATGASPAPALPAPTQVALLVPPAEYITALELLGSMVVPTAVGNALPPEFRSMIQPVQEAFLNTGNQPYYMARTEPGMRPVEIAYLRGRRAPSVTSAETINNTGITYRVLFPFGAAPVSARCIAANLG
jgi:ATP-dependent protease ClpP protease subunit